MRIAWKAVVVVLVLSVGLLGCTQSGYLTIENNTAAGVEIAVNGDDESLDAGEDTTFEYEFPGFVLNLIQQESETVEVEYIGWYVLPDVEELEIEADDDILFEIDPNAGAFVISNNNNPYPIIELYITPSSNPAWGDNLLGTGSMYAGGRFDFGPMSIMPWDVRIETSGLFWEIYNQTPTVNAAKLFHLDSDDVVRWGATDNGGVLPLAAGSDSIKVGP